MLLPPPAPPDDPPLYSVVVIFFDPGRFLAQAVESVFAQSCTNWELLLVDDGSKDGSSDLARQWAREWPERVRYFEHANHANLGQSASRNAGITHARGELVALLDADDVWRPDKLEQQLEIFRAVPRATLVCGRSELWTGSGQPHPDDSLSIPLGDPNTLMEPPELLRRWLSGQRTIPLPSNIAFRRGMTSRRGGYPEPFPRLYEDLAFMIKAFLHEPMFVSDMCWSRIRRHPDSCVARATPAEWNDAWLFFVTWLEGYLRESGLQDSEFWQPVQRELRPLRHPALFRLSRFGGRVIGMIARSSSRWLESR